MLCESRARAMHLKRKVRRSDRDNNMALDSEPSLKGRVTHMGVSEDRTIYRYLSIDRFLSIIENEENTLVHISKWEDPNEAYLIKARIAECDITGHDEDMRKWYDRYRTFYGQSWMFNGAESDVLWRAHGMRGETVRIATTVRGLCSTLERLIGIGGGYLNAFVGAISYDTEMRCEIPDDDMDLVKTLFMKRKEFSDETEFRAVVKLEDKDRRADKERSVINTSGGLLKYKIAVLDLIQSVLVDPCCTHTRLDEIRCRVMNAGFDIEIRKSALFNWPSTHNIMVGKVNEENVKATEERNVRDEVAAKSKVGQPPEVTFWNMFKADYRNGMSEFASRRAPDRRYWGFPIGNGLSYFVVFNRSFARVELYIDSPDKIWNERFVDNARELLGTNAGLIFDSLNDGRASRIAIKNADLRFTDETAWKPAVTWLGETLDKFRSIIEPMINQLIAKTDERS